jgi:hypothetical protein
MRSEVIDRLSVASSAFYVPLRMGEGFRQEDFEELCEALRDFGAVWGNLDEVPKKVAIILVDLPSAIEACSYAYEGEISDQILYAADRVADLVRGAVKGRERAPGRSGSALFVFVPRSEVKNLPSDVVRHDVSSRAHRPLDKLSPFYPHGSIPVPGSDSLFSDSVEGVWQGLKMIEGRVDASYFSGKGRKRRGKPEGHKFGDRLLGYIEARRLVYLPAYEYMWKMCVGRDIRSLMFKPALEGIVQYFYDYDDNGDIEDSRRPLAHSSILVRLLADEFDSTF